MEGAERLGQFLVQDWSSGLRLTTIPQAMDRLGIDDDLRLRWHVGRRLETLWRDTLTSPEKRRQVAAALGWSVDEVRDERWRQQVGTWNLASILLSEDEKLIARLILMRQRKDVTLPQPADIGKSLGLPVAVVKRAIRILVRLGFLSVTDRGQPWNYTLAERHEQFQEGLGFSFHTVTLETGQRFGVPWAVDFLLLVSSQYKEHYVTLDDACAHCVDRIHIAVDCGDLVEVYPEEAIVYRGGTWGQNNLFRSEEHLRQWAQGALLEPDRWTLVREFKLKHAGEPRGGGLPPEP